MLGKKVTNQIEDIVVSTIKGVAIISISAVVTILAARMVGGPQLSINQTSTQKQSTFDVTGQSEMTVVPDEAKVNLGVTVNRLSVAQAQQEMNTKINAISNKLQELGIKKEDIKTQNYSIYPDYDYRNERQIITGYHASTTLQVSLKDFEKMNQVIDEATALGANQLGGISFDLSTQKENQLKTEARKEAIEDAKNNAQELAKLSGMKLGRIVNIWETPNYDPQPYLNARAEYDLAAGLGGAAEPTSIEPGSTSYTYAVTLSFETL